MTDRQKRFIEEYLVDLNATQAAARAGYAPETANREGSRLLSNVDIQSAIQKAQQERSKQTQITAARVLEEYARIAFYDPSRVFGVDSNGLPTIDFSNATEDDWRVVAEVSNETQRIPGKDEGIVTKAKVKHQCKLQALNQIGRHLGMFNDKITHDFGTLSDAELIERAKAAIGGNGQAGSDSQ